MFRVCLALAALALPITSKAQPSNRSRTHSYRVEAPGNVGWGCSTKSAINEVETSPLGKFQNPYTFNDFLQPFGCTSMIAAGGPAHCELLEAGGDGLVRMQCSNAMSELWAYRRFFQDENGNLPPSIFKRAR